MKQSIQFFRYFSFSQTSFPKFSQVLRSIWQRFYSMVRLNYASEVLSKMCRIMNSSDVDINPKYGGIQIQLYRIKIFIAQYLRSTNRLQQSSIFSIFCHLQYYQVFRLLRTYWDRKIISWSTPDLSLTFSWHYTFLNIILIYKGLILILLNKNIDNKYKMQVPMDSFLQTKRPYEFMEKDQRDLKKVFQTLHQVDKKTLRLPQCCIFLCGQTRAGKSTLHNSIKNPKSIVGKEEGLNTYYILNTNNPEVSAIGNSLTSVTMIPNISIHNLIAIIDMPGLGERNKGIDVIKVNYINAKFFHSAKKAKFILVFTQGALKDIDNGGFKDTLHNFLSFFDLEFFSSLEEKKELFSSIAFCFTSVDFRRKPYHKVRQSYLQQLLVMLEKMEKLYELKKNELPSFPLAKELILHIVESKRVELFQLATQGQSPPDQTEILKVFDRNNWKYLNLRSKIDKIVFHYDQQYTNLSDQKEKEFIDEIIKNRFNCCMEIRTFFGEMLSKIVNNFGDKIINITDEVNELKKILSNLPNYGMAAELENPQQCTIDQRLVCLEKLDKIAFDMKFFDNWKQLNKLSPNEEYYTKYLTRIFEDQINLVNRLFFSSGCSDLFQDILVNIKKMLSQAAIFSRLSPRYESLFNKKFAQEITLANEISSIKIEQQFIEYFQRKNLSIESYTTDEIKRIIKKLGELKGKFTKINPTIFYGISLKLKQILAHKFRTNRMIGEFLEQSFSALVEAVKSHICFLLVPLASCDNQLQNLINTERNILNSITQIFKAENKQNYINYIMELKLAFESLVKGKNRNQFKNYLKSVFIILSDFIKNLFRSNILNKDQMPPTITIAFDANNQAQINMIVSQYEVVMKNQINEEKVKIDIPKTYSLSNQAQVYQKLIQLLKGKTATFVIGGEPLCGKSVVTQILRGKKMGFNKDGCFDVQKPSKSNRINHSKIPFRFPHLYPLDQNQMLVEIPSFFHLSQIERYIKMTHLLSLAKSTKRYRVVWVESENILKSKLFEINIKDIIRLLFEKQKVKESLIYLIVNHSMGDHMACRNYMNQHIASLNSGESFDKKVAKHLGFIITNTCIIQKMQNYQRIYEDFSKMKAVYFESSKLISNYGTISTKCILDQQNFVQTCLGKIKFVKNAISPLQGLASDSLNELVQGNNISVKGWFYNDIVRLLQDPAISSYKIDESTIPQYGTIARLIENKPFIFQKVLELRKKAEIVDLSYDHNITYRNYINYIDQFFKSMVYLCCVNKDQYVIFMRLKLILPIILKELQFCSLMFKDEKFNDFRFQELNYEMRFRDIPDCLVNFSELSNNDIVKILISQTTGWRDNELRSLLELLTLFIKSNPTPNSIKTAAMIELLIYTLRLKQNRAFVMNWDKDLTERRLVQSIFQNPDVQRNSSRNLLSYGKLQQQANELIINELITLKMRLIA